MSAVGEIHQSAEIKCNQNPDEAVTSKMFRKSREHHMYDSAQPLSSNVSTGGLFRGNCVSFDTAAVLQSNTDLQT